jgi:hypothetical protein
MRLHQERDERPDDVKQTVKAPHDAASEGRAEDLRRLLEASGSPTAGTSPRPTSSGTPPSGPSSSATTPSGSAITSSRRTPTSATSGRPSSTRW